MLQDQLFVIMNDIRALQEQKMSVHQFYSDAKKILKDANENMKQSIKAVSKNCV
jgi:hypothetical protein